MEFKTVKLPSQEVHLGRLHRNVSLTPVKSMRAGNNVHLHCILVDAGGISDSHTECNVRTTF
jgi:hypothetical protein